MPKSQPQPQSLEAVEAQFAQWRRTRTQLPTPLALKEQAVGLLAEHRISSVCQRLRINHEMLKRWQRELAAEPAAGFVALPMAVAPTPVGDEGRVRLTLTRRPREGEAMSIEAELSQAQWRWALGLLQGSTS